GPSGMARRGARLGALPGAACERLRADAAVGELDIDALASGNLLSGAHGAAVAVAHERVAALQHAMIAERSQELAAAVEVPHVLGDTGADRAACANGQSLDALVAACDAHDDGLQAEPAGSTLEPDAPRAGGASERSCRLSAQRVEPVVRSGQSRLEEAQIEPCA